MVCGLVLGGHTNGKQFNPSILQALRRGYDIILGLPIGDEDPYLGNTGSGAWLGFEAVLQDEGQSQTWSDLNEDKVKTRRRWNIKKKKKSHFISNQPRPSTICLNTLRLKVWTYILSAVEILLHLSNIVLKTRHFFHTLKSEAIFKHKYLKNY